MSLFPQSLETAVPGSAGNRCFCLLGSVPNPLNNLVTEVGCAAFRRFWLPPTVDFPFPSPLRGLRFFRRDGSIAIKVFFFCLPCLFPKFVEVAQERRELAFPEGVLIIGHFSGIVLGAGFYKSQSTVLEQRTGTSCDGLYIRLETRSV